FKDEGLIALDETETGYENIKDEHQNQVPQPWPLDGAGHPLSVSDKKAGKAHYRTYDIYYQKPFSVFNL
ncbi:unnamed protein product, partial [marine sediment metagenome]